MLTAKRQARGVEPALVLVVDDEPFNIDLLGQELEEMGHVPFAAADGVAAMDMIANQDFDLVLLDIMMPPEVMQLLNACFEADSLEVNKAAAWPRQLTGPPGPVMGRRSMPGRAGPLGGSHAAL